MTTAVNFLRGVMLGMVVTPAAMVFGTILYGLVRSL